MIVFRALAACFFALTVLRNLMLAGDVGDLNPVGNVGASDIFSLVAVALSDSARRFNKSVRTQQRLPQRKQDFLVHW